MKPEARVRRMGDRLQAQPGVKIGESGVMVTAGAASMWLGNEELSSVAPKPALTSNLWFNLGATCLVLAVVLALAVLVVVPFLPSREGRIDSQLREQAATLADRIEARLNGMLADDPLPPGRRSGSMSPEKTAIHNRLSREACSACLDEFSPEVRSLNNELQREQISKRFDTFLPAVSAIRALVRDLRAFNGTKGPLIRG
jgi:hypothetical protein